MSEKAERPPIPDRVAIDRDSPYYFPMCRKLGIKFNDLVIFNCAEFSVSGGWVKRIVETGRGKYKLERGKPVTVQHFGKVEPYWR